MTTIIVGKLDESRGFWNRDEEKVPNFISICKECGSGNVLIKDNIKWHPSIPDLWGSLGLVCRECGNTYEIINFDKGGFGEYVKEAL
jgi:hypothetical protein